MPDQLEVLRFALAHYRDECPDCEGSGIRRDPWPEAQQDAYSPMPFRDVRCSRCAIARRALNEGSEWKPTGRVDTGSYPPRIQWERGNERVWTADPNGPALNEGSE